MPDMEKVNGFELCANGEPCTGEKFMKCPFSPRNNAEQNCGVTMARYAIELQQSYYTLEHDWRMLKELLKNQEEQIDTQRKNLMILLNEQEAVEPKHNPLSPTDWFCGKCGMCISRFHDYCPSCGQAVKWE